MASRKRGTGPRCPATFPSLPRRLTIRDFIDLTQLTDFTVDWLYEPWIERDCLTLFGGEGGSLKSWLSLDMNIATASGQSWLGRKPSAPMPVVILDQDTGENITKRRIMMLCKGRGIEPSSLRDSLFILPRSGFKVDDDVARAELIGACRARSIRYITADALVAVHRADENDAPQMARVMRDHFGSIITHTGAGIKLIHHLNKPSKDHAGTTVNRMRGSGEIVNSSDCIISFKRNADGVIMELERSRSAPEEDWPEPITFTVDRDKEANSARVVIIPAGLLNRAAETIRSLGLAGLSVRTCHERLKSNGHDLSESTVARALRRIKTAAVS